MSFKKYTIYSQDTIQTWFTGNKLNTEPQEHQQLNWIYMTQNLFSFESCSQILVKTAYTRNILQSDCIFLEYPSLKLLTLTCNHLYLQYL